MRTIIAGSRDFTDYQDIESAISCIPWVITTVICGKARGADTYGDMWAIVNGIPREYYPAQWKINGVFDKSAGYKRNILMAENADALLAIWDGQSRGTSHMIYIANTKGLTVYTYQLIPF